MPTISGIVKDSAGAFAQRMVRAYRRDTGALIGQTVSNATTGAYSITTPYSGEHFVLMHDGTATVGDAYWDSVVLACHFDGTNGSTTFTDEKGHTLTAYGNAQVSTAQSKFGGSSAYFDGTGDYLTAADNADFALGAGDFTVEAFVYVTSFANSPVIVDTRQTAGGAGAAFYLNTSGQPTYFVAAADRLTSVTAIAQNTWTHVAFVRASGVTKIYIGGVATGTTYSDTLSITEYGLTVGATIDYRSAASGYHFQGYIDNLRITKGVARYTANFTPPAAAFLGAETLTGGAENILAFDRVTPV